MENENGRSVCSGKSCTYGVVKGALACGGGDAYCLTAEFLEAEESVFHDADLIAASAAINEILKNIPEDKEGRKLAFISTNMGALLAWVSHDIEITDDAVTPEDDDATIANALGLKNFENTETTQAY